MTMRVVTDAASIIVVALIAVVVVLTQRSSSSQPQEPFIKPIEIVTVGQPGASLKEFR